MPKLIPYKLELSPRDGYLYARIECDKITEAISRDYLGRIRKECDDHGLSRVLIDRYIPHVTETVAKYAIASTSVDILSRVKTAWVNPFPKNREMLEFAMLVANNRGAMYGVFDTVAEAEQWLQNDGSA